MLVFSHLKSEEVEGSDSHALPLVVGLRESSTLVAEPLAHVVEKTIQLLERRPTHVDRERQLRPDRDCLWLTTDKTLGGGTKAGINSCINHYSFVTSTEREAEGGDAHLMAATREVDDS